MYALFKLAVALLCVAEASAHGYNWMITIDGLDHLGYPPNTNATTDDPKNNRDLLQQSASVNQSIIWQKTSDGPVFLDDPNSSNMSCGLGAIVPASQVADVQANSTVEIQWQRNENGAPFFHGDGPMMFYLAPCPNNDCTNFTNIQDAEWVKFHQKGVKKEFNWTLLDIEHKQPYAFNFPDVPPGQYIMRHELLVLSTASDIHDPNDSTKGGVEIYPSCAQVNVVASSNSSGSPRFPKQGDNPELFASFPPTNKFPNDYHNTDPGLHIDISKLGGQLQQEYNCALYPGPKMAGYFTQFNEPDCPDPRNRTLYIDDNNADLLQGSNPDPSSTLPSNSASLPTGSESLSNSGGSASTASNNLEGPNRRFTSSYRPRRISRIMRDLSH